jgi:outer membrane beta-barrel protein
MTCEHPGRGLLLSAALALALSAPGAARAAEVVYGPDGAPTVVQNKLHPMTGLWEVGGRLVTALNPAYVQHTGGILSITYHPNESVDVGVDLLGNLAQASDLASRIRENLPTSTALAQWKNELANAEQVKWGAFAVVRVAPVYGKLSLASELALHLQAYLLAGAGVGGIHKESVNLCAAASGGNCQGGPFLATDAVKPMGELGGGLRLYLGEKWSLLLELRELLYPTSLQVLTDPAVATSGISKSGLGNLAELGLGLAGTF